MGPLVLASLNCTYVLVARPRLIRCPMKGGEPTIPNSAFPSDSKNSESSLGWDYSERSLDSCLGEADQRTEAVPDETRLRRLPSFTGKYGGSVAVTRLFFTEHHVESLLSKLPTSTMPRQAGVLNNALDAVGHTPLIRLDKVAKDAGLKCNLRTSRLSG